jgi:hypothetical protein
MPCTSCTARVAATGKVQLEGTYTDPTARCCNGTTCTVTTESACTGTWGPASVTTCTFIQEGFEINNRCEDNGACCEGTTCVRRNEDDCDALPGVYMGKDTSCDTPSNPCLDPTGSCCRGSVCNVTNESNCSDGQFTAAGTCSAGDCPQGTGSYFVG